MVYELKGIGVSSGIALGKAFVYEKETRGVMTHKIDLSNTNTEINKLNKALAEAKGELLELIEITEKTKGGKQAAILYAQLNMIDDPELIDSVKTKITDLYENVELALFNTVEEISALFGRMEDSYFMERVNDFKDIYGRIMDKLQGIKKTTLADICEQSIVIAYDLLPSDTASMNLKHILAFATELGGATAHTSIMARAYGIPAIVGIEGLTKIVKHGDFIIVDGENGIAIVNPPNDIVSLYEKKSENFKCCKPLTLKELKCKLKDGEHMPLLCNIGKTSDCERADCFGIDGIGLFRTELLFMESSRFPSEDEQFKEYEAAATIFTPRQVIIRTLDIGGDKALPYYELAKETNPFLGFRAIRVCLDKTDIFKTQLRAILRASYLKNVSIILPMVISIEEMRKSRALLEECKKELKSENTPFDENIKLGAMIETPAAAIISDLLAKEADFFSIGTNDLTQYTLAVERGNAKVNHLYNPFHPAVVRSCKLVIDSSHREGKWTGICGELGGDVRATLMLVGLGIDKLSVSTSYVLDIKNILSKVTREECENIAKKVLCLSSASETEEYLNSVILQLSPTSENN